MRGDSNTPLSSVERSPRQEIMGENFSTMWKLSNMLLNNQLVKEEIKGDQKVPPDKQKWKYNISKTYSCSKSSSKREI